MRIPATLRLNAGDSINRGLVGYWPLNAASGNRAPDIGPYRLTGALNNITPGATSGWQGSALGKSLRFDGSNDYVTIPQSTFPSGNSVYSASFWVYCTNTAVTQKFLVWGKPGTVRNCVLIGVSSAGKINVSHWGDDWDSPITLAANTWTHIAVVYNGTGDALYVNGVPVASDTVAAPLSVDVTTKPAELGRLDTVGEYFTGLLSQVRIWRRMLTKGEIARLYADPTAGTAQVRFPVGIPGTNYPLSADGITRHYSFGPATFPRGFPLTAEGVRRRYSFGDATLAFSGQVLGDTHDGFKRRSRRERALDAAAERQRQEWIAERNGLRLALEAAMGMAAEVVEDAPPAAVEAVQEAAQEAHAVAPVLALPAMDAAALGQARVVVAQLQAAVEEAMRLRALAEDDEDVMMLLRAL